MTADLVVRGGRAVLAGVGVAAVDIGVTDGRIVEVAPPGTVAAHELVDAQGLLVLPGAVDMHVHFRQPGLEHKEDFAHGTRAAACGGVTVVGDMPNTEPPVVDAERLVTKRALVERDAWVDFALWAGGVAVEQLRSMWAEGAIGLKVYMNRSHRADDPYSDALSMPDLETFRGVLSASRELGWPVTVHVTDHESEARTRELLRGRSRTDARLVCRSYRGDGALEGLRQVLALARETAARIHVAHVSLAPVAALDLVAEARADGVSVTCECGPPALVEDDLDRLGVYGTPFAFPPEDAERYWKAIADGPVDCVATDHAPHSREDKAVGRDDVWQAPPGHPGVETCLPLMLDAALRGVFGLNRLVSVMSAEPARILELPGKGRIAVGCDADLVLVDPDTETVVDERRLHSKAGWSPFHGRRLRGRLTATYLRGALVACDGDVVGHEPRGRFLPGRSPR